MDILHLSQAMIEGLYLHTWWVSIFFFVKLVILACGQSGWEYWAYWLPFFLLVFGVMCCTVFLLSLVYNKHLCIYVVVSVAPSMDLH